jgi:hypothetical protein
LRGNDDKEVIGMIIKYNTIICENDPFRLEEDVKFHENDLDFPLHATVNLEHCGEIVGSEIVIDTDRLNSFTNILYDDYISLLKEDDDPGVNITKIPQYDFNIVNFFIQVDDSCQLPVASYYFLLRFMKSVII